MYPGKCLCEVQLYSCAPTQYDIGVAKLAGVMHPYPTEQEVVRQCAGMYNKNFKTEVNKRALQLIMEDVKKSQAS